MSLNEVLKLDMVQSSIRKIDLFLVSSIKQSDEYLAALAYKCIILHKIGKSNEALKLLFSQIPAFKEFGSNGIISICDAIIDICIDVKKYDQVEKYIQIKKNYLPVSKSVLHIKDNIKYYLSAGMQSQAKEELIKYLSDDIEYEEAIFAKEELSNIYYFEHSYDKYLELIPYLETYYQTNLNIAKLSKISLNKLIIYFDKGNFIRVIVDGLAYLKDDGLKTDYKLTASALVIKSYIKTNELKKASIIESDYCEYISEEYLSESLDFAYAALDLYTKLGTIISIKEYQNKILELKQEKKEIKSIKKNKKSKDNLDDIVIPIIDKDTIEEINEPINYDIFKQKTNKKEYTAVQKIEQKIETVKSVVVSESFNKLSVIFDYFSELDLNIKFREIFRNACIKICEFFNIEEIYLLYFKREYLGLHYKKERAYDKKLKPEEIENTINFNAMQLEQELFLDPEDDLYKINIIDKKEYTNIPYAYCMPLSNTLNCYASIAYFSSNPFLDKELVYEAIKLISSCINTRLQMSLAQDDIEYNNKKTFFITENMSSGMKEEIDGFLHFSPQACEILGVFENMRQDDYFSKMKTPDIIEYKRIYEELYTLLSTDCILEYDFKKNNSYIRIRERFYPMVIDGVICILSLIDDITEDEKNKNSLIALAYNNPISKLQTEVKLMIDLKNLYEARKMSLAVVDIIDFNLYRELYGYNFTNQLIYTVGQELVNAFSNEFLVSVYHLEIDRYVILFNEMNDKRVIDSKLKPALKRVSNELYKLNSRVKLEFNCGVYRVQAHSNLDDPSKILYNALDALADAKDLKREVTTICHFDSELQKQRFRENHLVTHISESIDHGKIGLTYKQIVDLNTSSVFGYYVSLNLDNFEIDYGYMDYVVKRRGLTARLDKYVVSNLFKELKMMKDVLSGTVLSFVEVDNETLYESFNSFLDSQKSFFKINIDNIAIIVNEASLNPVKACRAQGYKIASRNLLDVFNDLCDYFIIDYHLLELSKINEIKELCKKHNTECIISGINNKDDILIARENNFEIIYGDYYKKAIRMKSIIEKVAK